MSKSKFQAGDIVKVRIPEESRKGNPVALYHNSEQKVSKAFPRRGKIDGYVELAGAVSGRGVPFTFLNEWIEKVD